MPAFTESDIRTGASPQSFSRGVGYYHDGSVLEISQRDKIISAEVAGSDDEPYQVTITLSDSGGIYSADCTCPFDQGGHCKHIVAALLSALNDASDVEVRPGMDSLLAGLGEAELRQLIVAVAHETPGFADAIERNVSRLRVALSAPPRNTTAVSSAAPQLDLASLRRGLRLDFREAKSDSRGRYRDSYYYDDDDRYIDAEAVLNPHLASAQSLLDAGYPATAVELLSMIIDEWGKWVADFEEWEYESNEENFDQAARLLDALLAECLLSQPLSVAERQEWVERIAAWADETMRLPIAGLALDTWWDYPPLIAAMQGNITEQGAWEGEPPDEADDLAEVRLSILERQGRTQEYLNLAQAEGEFELYLIKLVEIGEIQRAVDEVLTAAADATLSLIIARVLAGRGYPREALAVASHGLDAQPDHSVGELARWLIPVAEQEGNQKLALTGARLAFLQRYDLNDYQNAQRLAGDAWPTVKAELLPVVRRLNNSRSVEIYLYERMLPEAMAVVDRNGFYGDPGRVIEATRGDYPDWAIQQCKRNAEPIMTGGKASHYSDAAGWLRLARDIYVQHDRLAEWRPYLRGLLETHGRKHKLVPMLRELA